MDKDILVICEKEQLHLSGQIQPHGTLLALDSNGRISHVAENLHRFLPYAPEALLGAVLPPELAALLSGFVCKPGHRRLQLEALEGLSGPLDAVLTQGATDLLIELSPHLDFTPDDPLAKLRPVPTPGNAAEVESLQHTLVDQIARLIDAQRVTFYQFREDGDGEVTAEFLAHPTAGSYLGLRFPASDIPKVARRLYLKNSWRYIPDSQARPVSIMAATDQMLDLTHSGLRSVSEVHQVYLANMGVGASASFPLALGEQLMAMVTVHHSEPRRTPLAALELAAAWTHAHASALGAFQTTRRMRFIDGLSRQLDFCQISVQRHGSILAAWPTLAPALMERFNADGITLIVDDESYSSGEAFPPETLARIDEWRCDQVQEPIWICDSLLRTIADLPVSGIAGCIGLHITTPKEHDLRLYLARREYLHQVAWGGQPNKPVEFHDGQIGISPRRSFEKWVENRMGYCRPWTNEDRLMAIKLRELLRQNLP